jgi:hypothetical protein
MSDYDSSTLVYVAAFPDPRPDHRGALIETRILSDGDPAALAFTSQEGLVAALGPAQPWIAVPLGLLRQWVGSTSVSTVAVDPEIAPEAVRWNDDDVDVLSTIVSRGDV